MNETSQSIVTTSISPLGSPGNEIVLLGSWCSPHPQINVQQETAIEVVQYHWDDRARISLDLARIRKEYEYLLPQLANRLNAIHATNHSLRFWRILVGWWLYSFLQILFDRWAVLENAAELYPNATITRLSKNVNSQVSPDTKHFLESCTTDEWNERFWADLAQEWTVIRVMHDEQFLSKGSATTPTSLITSAAAELSSTGHWKPFASFLNGYSGAVALQGDYLKSSTTRFRLAIKFQSMPRLLLDHLRKLLSKAYLSGPVQSRATNPELRKWKLSARDDSSYSRIASDLVGKFIPTGYLEDFSDLQARASKLPLPKSPKFAFTANSFSCDDVWKVWAALATEGGTKLVIGQHGGGYGSYEWITTLEHEIAIADRYLTWGWSDSNNPKVVPAVAGKLIGVRKARTSGKSCLLLSTSLPKYSSILTAQPIAGQYEKFLSNLLEFAGMLDPEIQAELAIRPGTGDYGRNLEARWQDTYPNATVSTDPSSYWRDIRSAKVCISAYNGTAPIEILATGQPMVWYLDPSLFEFAPRFDEIASQMISAKILFFDKEECALHVNSIWADVYQWWSEPSVQTVVSNFLSSYGNIGRRPIKQLAQAIAQFE